MTKIKEIQIQKDRLREREMKEARQVVTQLDKQIWS